MGAHTELVGALQAPWLAAQAVVDSPTVLGVYAACEWDELDDDGKAWVKAIVEEARKPLLAFAQLVARYEIDGPDICQDDVQDTFREVIASARQLTGYMPSPDLAEASAGFTCQACGRPEWQCSACPCPEVEADRADHDDEPCSINRRPKGTCPSGCTHGEG